MSVVTLRSDPAVVRGQSQARPEMKAFSVDGSAHIRFSADKTGRTRLADLYQSNPLRVLFPYTEAGEPETAVIVTTSGGLVGGDRLSLSLELEPNAAASVIGQASEKIYRSVKDESRLNVDLYVDNGAQFEYLPQDTIVFDGSRFSRHTNLHIATDTRVLAGEMLVLGRLAHNETFRSGRLEEVWRVHVDGKLVWYDRFVLGDDMASIIEHPFGLDGANAVATIVCHGPNLEDLQNRAHCSHFYHGQWREVQSVSQGKKRLPQLCTP